MLLECEVENTCYLELYGVKTVCNEECKGKKLHY